jgi:hypothetical protein
MPSPGGMPQTKIPSKRVTTEPIKVAAHADIRKTASRTSKVTTGIKATSQVTARLPNGFTGWVNIANLPFNGALCRTRPQKLPAARLQARVAEQIKLRKQKVQTE